MRPKLIFNAGQDALFLELGGHFATLIEPGLFRKHASVLFGPQDLARYKPDKDHFLAHYIGIGAHEAYGENRNFDAFTKTALAKYTGTFVTNGHYFDEHRNRDPKKKIGDIKAAAFSPETMRSELLIWGHKKKAEKQYERIKKGEALTGSMSCKIPWDRCNACGNKAPTRADYCDCLTNHLGEFIPGRDKYAVMMNDEPTFFDYSDVGRQADRIAYAVFTDANDMDKAASVKAGSAEDLAEFHGVCLPETGALLDILVRAQLEKLAAAEAWFETVAGGGFKDSSDRGKFASLVLRNAHGEEVDERIFKAMNPLHVPGLLRKMARHQVILPFADFHRWIFQSDPSEELMKSACSMLPSIFRSLLSGGSPVASMVDEFKAGGPLSEAGDPQSGDEIDNLMSEAGERLGCGPDQVQGRTLHIIIKMASPRQWKPVPINPTIPENHKRVIHAYGLYKLAAVNDMIRLHGMDESAASIRRDIAVSQNFLLT